ncbi:MAG: hypothetical protein ACI8T1_001853 [Verrucomicrobiales bacterium]|jgi:hypothetical protein
MSEKGSKGFQPVTKREALKPIIAFSIRPGYSNDAPSADSNVMHE